MILECFGVPGAGKSTFTTKICEELLIPEIPMYSSKISAMKTMILLHRFSYWWMFELVRQLCISRSWKLFRFKMSLFLNTAGRLVIAKKIEKKYGVAVLDEGMLQRLLSLFDDVPDEAVYARLVRAYDVTHGVVLLSTKEAKEPSVKSGTTRYDLGADFIEQSEFVMKTGYQKISKLVQEQFVTFGYDYTNADTGFTLVYTSLHQFRNSTKV